MNFEKPIKTIFPSSPTSFKAISAHGLDSSSWFGEVFYQNKESLHSLTHGGTRMIMLLYADDAEKIEADYPVGEQLRLMKIVDEITIGAAAELRKHLNC